MSIVADAVSGIFKPLTDLYGNRQKRIAQESEAKANLDRIMTEAAAADSTVAGQIALVNSKNQNATWKDEFALITIAAPFWVAMVLGPMGHGDVVGEMFTAMNMIPEFWEETFKYGILGALGITQLKKAITR
jgi:hypothetical protein